MDRPGMRAPQKLVDMALPPVFAQEVIKSLKLPKGKQLLVFELFGGVGGFSIGQNPCGSFLDARRGAAFSARVGVRPSELVSTAPVAMPP